MARFIMDERPSNFQMLRYLEGEGDDEGFRKFFNQVKSGLTTKEKEDLLLSFSWRLDGIISIKGGCSSLAELLFMDGTVGATVQQRCSEIVDNAFGMAVVTTWEDQRIELFDKNEMHTIYKKHALPILISLQNLNLPALQTVAILHELFPVTPLLDREFIWNLVVGVKEYRKMMSAKL